MSLQQDCICGNCGLDGCRPAAIPVLIAKETPLQQSLVDIYDIFFGTAMVVAPAYLVLAAMAAFMVYRTRKIPGGFWRWLVPRAIYLHPSHLIDIQLFAIGRGLSGLGLVAGVSVTTLVAAWVASLMPAPILVPQSLSPLVLALVLWLPTDFVNYWWHRLHHRWSVIWPLHAVHHSAEVLTPLTTYRQHPVHILMSVFVQSAVIGVFQGVVLGVLSPDLKIAEIAGINAFFVITNAAFAALHHSHVWLSYGPVLERLIISPAQHQIHHSQDRAHYDRNFGTTLAVWDWMFGTLYITRGPENLKLGLSEPLEKPLMSQRIWPILWDPVRRLLRARG